MVDMDGKSSLKFQKSEESWLLHASGLESWSIPIMILVLFLGI